MRRADLFLDVVEGIRRVDGEADEDDMGVGIGQGTKTVVILLTSRVPQS